MTWISKMVEVTATSKESIIVVTTNLASKTNRNGEKCGLVVVAQSKQQINVNSGLCRKVVVFRKSFSIFRLTTLICLGLFSIRQRLSPHRSLPLFLLLYSTLQ